MRLSSNSLGAWVPRVGALGCLALFLALPLGCATMGLRSAVSMTVKPGEQTPADALVYIDGQYIGSLAAVAARGVRVPEGEHRLTVEKNGYFPYDTIIVSDLDPIALKVELLRLPE